MTYTAPELVTIVAAIGVLVSSIGGVVINIITSLRNGQKSDKLITAVIGDASTPGLKEQVKEIHTVTNSNLALAKALNERQVDQIAALQNMINELKSEREKKEIAAATAIVPPTAVAQQPAAPAAATTVMPPVIIVKNVTAENVEAKSVTTEVLNADVVKPNRK